MTGIASLSYTHPRLEQPVPARNDPARPAPVTTRSRPLPGQWWRRLDDLVDRCDDPDADTWQMQVVPQDTSGHPYLEHVRTHLGREHGGIAPTVTWPRLGGV